MDPLLTSCLIKFSELKKKRYICSQNRDAQQAAYAVKRQRKQKEKKKNKTTIPQGRIELPTFAFLNTAYKYDALTDCATGERCLPLLFLALYWECYQIDRSTTVSGRGPRGLVHLQLTCPLKVQLDTDVIPRSVPTSSILASMLCRAGNLRQQRFGLTFLGSCLGLNKARGKSQGAQIEEKSFCGGANSIYTCTCIV